ncbi:uncharacterized protein [Drosophila takahashii]|uniref:uncharacterized protein n=1 Tax=Drosophila takahashii TaxID=29030 RepID=UPI003899195B
MKFLALFVFLFIALVAVHRVDSQSPSFLKCLEEITEPELCENFKDEFPDDSPSIPLNDYTFEEHSG